jgi:hypothetical protein
MWKKFRGHPLNPGFLYDAEFLPRQPRKYLDLVLEPDCLVYRLLNPFNFAAGRLAVFRGASDEHI